MSSWILGEALIKQIVVHKPVFLRIELVSCLLYSKHWMLLKRFGLIIRQDVKYKKLTNGHWMNIFCRPIFKNPLHQEKLSDKEVTWIPDVCKYGIS